MVRPVPTAMIHPSLQLHLHLLPLTLPPPPLAPTHRYVRGTYATRHVRHLPSKHEQLSPAAIPGRTHISAVYKRQSITGKGARERWDGSGVRWAFSSPYLSSVKGDVMPKVERYISGKAASLDNDRFFPVARYIRPVAVISSLSFSELSRYVWPALACHVKHTNASHADAALEVGYVY